MEIEHDMGIMWDPGWIDEAKSLIGVLLLIVQARPPTPAGDAGLCLVNRYDNLYIIP
jgi:hypothetical protein